MTSVNLPEHHKRALTLFYSTKKVSEYNSEELKQLFKFLLALCKLIGVTEPPEQEIVLLLIDHIQEHHKDFSKEEIQRAFSLATAGKLNFEFRHYNRLTPQMISHVLNHYKQQRSRSIIDYENKLREEEIERKRKESIPSAEEMLDTQIHNAVQYYEGYCNFQNKTSSDYPMDWGSYTYLFLKKLGLINTTKLSQQEIIKEAKLALAQDLHKKKRAVKISEILSNTESFEMKRMCRKISLDRYCKTIFSSNLDIRDIINKALDNNVHN